MRALLLALVFLPLGLLAQGTTTLTATVTDSTGQLWANGSYSITFTPVPGLQNNYIWQGQPFVPLKYQGVFDNSGTFTVVLPDSNTITPAGTQWSFVLCPNATSQCTTVVTPVSGSTENLTSFFSSRVTPPQIFAAPLPRAYTTAEVATPPPLQGGQFYQVSNNIPYFWSGTQWIALGGTVSSVGLSLPSIFAVTGSPVTAAGVLAAQFISESGNTVFANCATTAALPTFCLLTAAMIAQAGTLSNNTTGTAAQANGVAGGYVSSVAGDTGISVSPVGGQGNVTVSNSGVTRITAGTNVTISPTGGTGVVTINATGSAGIEESFATSGCTPASSTDSSCTGTITLVSAMPDTSYQPLLTVNSINGAFLSVSVSGSITTTTIPYTISCTFNCSTVVTPTLYVFARHP